MPIYLSDCPQDLVLQTWQQPRPAIIRAVPEKTHMGEAPHLWHASTSSTEKFEVVTMSAAWTGTIRIFPDSAASNTLKVKLQINTHPAYRA